MGPQLGGYGNLLFPPPARPRDRKSGGKRVNASISRQGRQIIIELRRAAVKDAYALWKLQLDAFTELLDKYQDYNTSPANEAAERTEARLKQTYSYFYYIMDNDKTVGAIRVVDMRDGSRKRISPIFVMKEYRNKGYAQAAIKEAERIHGEDYWELDTILQEAANCHLYEKMGYHRTGKQKSLTIK